MKKSDIEPLPQYFDRDINTVDDVELSQAFARSGQQLEQPDKSLLTKLADHRSAPGTWTIKERFQRLIDWERILSY